MWDLRVVVPQPGIEPVYPAVEGRFFTTEPPGKSCLYAILSKDDKLCPD